MKKACGNVWVAKSRKGGYRIATDSMQENVANTMENLLGGNVVNS